MIYWLKCDGRYVTQFLHFIWSLPMYICMSVCIVYVVAGMSCFWIVYYWNFLFIGECQGWFAYQLNQLVSLTWFLWVIAFSLYHFVQRLIISDPYLPVTIQYQYKCSRFNIMVTMGHFWHYIDLIFKYMHYKLMLYIYINVQ